MLSPLRFTASRPRTSPARNILAAMLVVVLLAGVAPLSALSRSHQCRMACCVGKSPHAEGSCSVSFLSETQAEEPDEQVEAEAPPAAHAHHMSVGVEDHVASTHHSSAQHAASGKEQSHTARVVSQAITTPCSPECAAAAVSSSIQLRGQRDAAAMSTAGSLHPPARIHLTKEVSTLLWSSSETGRQIRPRAPPLSLVHFSA